MRLFLALGFWSLTASAAPFVLQSLNVPLDRRVHTPTADAAGVSYYGGPVISHVKAYVVYWGEGVDAGTQEQLHTFYSYLVNSTYLDRLAEYGTKVKSVDGRDGTQQEVGRGTLAGTYTIQPVNIAKTLTQAEIEQELEAQIANGALPKPDADSYYALHFPDGYSISISFGYSCSTWLADHEVYVSKHFGNVYYAMFPCDSGDSQNFDTLTMAASHEMAEAITDAMSPLSGAPSVYPAGWLRADGQEIGDLCMNTGASLVAGTNRYNVNALWLNSENGCHGGDYLAQ